MFFDMHADIWTNTLWEYEKGNKDIIRSKFKHKFTKGNMMGGIFILWLDEYDENKAEKRFMQMIETMKKELYYTRDFIQIIKDVNDFEKAIKNNKLSVVIGVEGLLGIGKNIDYIYDLDKLGVRHIGLTWNESNELATGQSGDSNRGVTNLGKDAIKIIDELDILLDVSHLNDKSFWDVSKYYKKPFFASHSNSRTLCNVARNLTDTQLECIKERNGMVGLNSYHNFVSENADEKTLDMFINHLEYIANKIGLDKVGFGFDFLDYFAREDEVEEVLLNLKDVTELDNITKILKKRGYSNNEIDMIKYKNFISFFNRVR